jgi:hypothetical protein
MGRTQGNEVRPGVAKPSAGDGGAGTAVVCVIAVIAVAALSAILTFVLPRPFFVLSNDYDNGHYYNVRALYEGLPIHNVEHPGTPVFLLGRLAMTPSTADPANVGEFLSRMYVIAGAATCAGLALFCWLVIRPFPAPVAALALSTLAAWPAFLVHLNTFCTESFVLGAGLVALAGLWLVLEAFPTPRIRDLAFAGAACGVALSVKLSFIPFVGAMAFAVVISVLRSQPPAAARVRGIFVFLVSLAASFLVAVLPVAHRLGEIILGTLHRPDVTPGSSTPGALATAFRVIVAEQPIFAALFATSMLLTIAIAVHGAARRVRERSKADVGFDGLGSLCFLLPVSGAFLYALACAAGEMPAYDSVGHSLRNASPAALAVPFAILCFHRLVVPDLPAFLRPSQAVSRLVVLGAIALAATSVSWHLSSRKEMILERSRIVAETRARFEELRQANGPVAFWDGSPGWRLGEASFHFWGNYRYAEGVFSGELRRAFPGMTWLHLRNIRHLYGDGSAVPPASGTSGRARWPAPLHGLLTRWSAYKSRFPLFPRARLELFAGESEGLLPGLLAFPEREARLEVYDRLGLSRGELHAWLQARLGPLELRTELIGGTEWLLFERIADGKGTGFRAAESPTRAESPERAL